MLEPTNKIVSFAACLVARFLLNNEVISDLFSKTEMKKLCLM
jgi:hypothetical protein